MNRYKRPTRPGLNSPNQEQGSIESYENGLGWVPKTGTVGQVPTVQADGGVEFATIPTPTLDFVANKKVTEFTGDGTWTRDANCILVWVRGVGGGGGGGGADSDGTFFAAAAGGGGGGYVEEWFTATEAGSSQSVTIGAAGSAGSNAGGNGTAGGNTTFGSLFTASGGPLGDGVIANGADAAGVATSGGAATGGAPNIPGSGARAGIVGAAGSPTIGSDGGSSQWGRGGFGAIATTAVGVAGSAGVGYGAGGGGGVVRANVAGAAGGAGTAGYLIVTEFLKA